MFLMIGHNSVGINSQISITYSQRSLVVTSDDIDSVFFSGFVSFTDGKLQKCMWSAES